MHIEKEALYRRITGDDEVLGHMYLFQASLTGSAPGDRRKTKTTTNTNPSTPVSRKHIA